MSSASLFDLCPIAYHKHAPAIHHGFVNNSAGVPGEAHRRARRCTQQKTRRSTSACAPVVPLYKKDGRPLVPSQQAPGLIGRSHAGGAQVVLTAGVKRDIYCNHRLLPKRRQIQTKSAQPSTQPHGYTPPMRDTRSTPVTAWVQGSARQI